MVKTVRMAPDGPIFSELVQGYWRMGDWGRNAQEHLRFLKSHVELGITTVDHAHVYGGAPSCEELFGQVLGLDPTVRDQIQIVSKCGIQLVGDHAHRVNHYDSTPQAITHSVETSLRRLGIEQLDVLLIHRPDWLMDVDAIASTFDTLKNAGKVAHFGVSNFTASQFELLQSRLEASLVTNQLEINPFNLNVLDDGSLDLAYQHQIRPMAWSCLGGGQLFTGDSDQAVRIRRCLTQIASELDIDSIDQVAYAWAMTLPSKPVAIIGSGNLDRLKGAVASLDLELTQEQWYRVWVASMGFGVP